MIETRKILEQLENETNLKTILTQNKSIYSEADFSHQLYYLLELKSMKASDLIKKTQLSKSYVYKLLAGERSISRDKLLQITFVLGCTLEETTTLFKYAGVPELYPKKERDCIIIYAILNKMSLHEAGQLLLANNYRPLQDMY